MLNEILDFFTEEEFLIADGLDEAVIGVDENTMRLIYSTTKCIRILMENGMEYEESVEFFEFNIKGAHMGEKTPIWCFDGYSQI